MGIRSERPSSWLPALVSGALAVLLSAALQYTDWNWSARAAASSGERLDVIEYKLSLLSGRIETLPARAHASVGAAAQTAPGTVSAAELNDLRSEMKLLWVQLEGISAIAESVASTAATSEAEPEPGAPTPDPRMYVAELTGQEHLAFVPLDQVQASWSAAENNRVQQTLLETFHVADGLHDHARLSQISCSDTSCGVRVEFDSIRAAVEAEQALMRWVMESAGSCGFSVEQDDPATTVAAVRDVNVDCGGAVGL